MPYSHALTHSLLISSFLQPFIFTLLSLLQGRRRHLTALLGAFLLHVSGVLLEFELFVVPTLEVFHFFVRVSDTEGMLFEGSLDGLEFYVAGASEDLVSREKLLLLEN